MIVWILDIHILILVYRLTLYTSHWNSRKAFKLKGADNPASIKEVRFGHLLEADRHFVGSANLLRRAVASSTMSLLGDTTFGGDAAPRIRRKLRFLGMAGRLMVRFLVEEMS